MGREKPDFPPLTPGVTRLSYSGSETYLGCGVRYLRQREERHRRTNVALARGSAVDQAVTADDQRKLENGGGGLPPRDVIELAVSEYEREFDECEHEEARLVIDAGKDSTAEVATLYATRVSPGTVPIESQPAIVASLGAGLEVAGVLDRTVSHGPLDTKVGRKRAVFDAQTSRQLTTQGILYRARHGRWPTGVGFDSFHETGGRWFWSRVWARRREEQYRAHVEVLRRVQEGIERGVFLPAAEGSWRCSERWCEFWRSCEYAQGRRGV